MHGFEPQTHPRCVLNRQASDPFLCSGGVDEFHSRCTAIGDLALPIVVAQFLVWSSGIAFYFLFFSCCKSTAFGDHCS